MTKTANGSSSSAAGRPETPQIDLVASQRLPAIPRALLDGREADLLAPLRFLQPGQRPESVGPADHRADLAAALGDANEGYGHPRARALAEKLADPATQVVVTGQQAGIYGGPLLTLTKMAAAVRWAETLEADGTPAVAVFWIATEDHDWAEATRTSVLLRDALLDVDLGDDPSPLRPMGGRVLGERLAQLAGRLGQALEGEPWGNEAMELAGRHYARVAGFGDAFAGFFAEILGERAPLFLDSQLPALKEAQKPWLRALVDKRREIDTALTTAVADLERRGLPVQVSFQPGESPLFFLSNGERRRIEWRGAHGFVLRGTDEERPIDSLYAALEENPSCLSPGVLCRPAVQDAVLGTCLQVMGPAETSYLTQASAVYRELGLDGPWTTLRPQVMVFEQRQLDHLAELGVGLDELLSTEVDEILADRLHDDFLTPVRDQVRELLEGLREPAMTVEAQLEKPLEKTLGQIDRALDTFNGKVTAAVGRRNEVWQRRLMQARDQALPGGHLQERHLGVLHYLARYGTGFASVFWEDFSLDPRWLQVLCLTPRARTPERQTAGEKI